jgi:hypothetical protein
MGNHVGLCRRKVLLERTILNDEAPLELHPHDFLIGIQDLGPDFGQQTQADFGFFHLDHGFMDLFHTAISGGGCGPACLMLQADNLFQAILELVAE